jgi:hypothetical protein
MRGFTLTTDDGAKLGSFETYARALSASRGLPKGTWFVIWEGTELIYRARRTR